MSKILQFKYQLRWTLLVDKYIKNTQVLLVQSGLFQSVVFTVCITLLDDHNLCIDVNAF